MLNRSFVGMNTELPLKSLHSVLVVPSRLTITAGGEQSRSGNLRDRVEVEKLPAAHRGGVLMLMLAVDVKGCSNPYSSTILSIHLISLKSQKILNQPMHSPIIDGIITYN